ncbi:hypothetical protein, partial [Actinosynnema sp.]|uniref:hypothetical protein n=1 Tax=Actinosynnema sp. TaxID=1872144 RepID=UPI003F826DCE
MADHHDETPVGALREAVHDQTTTSIQQAAQGSADAAVRRWLPWTTALMCVVAALTSATVAVAVQHSVQLGAAEASVIDRREAVAQARGRGDSANAVLRARGQQVVQIPQL